MMTYTLVRIDVARGKQKYSEDLSMYMDYNPHNIMDDVRADTEINSIPRMMMVMDGIYGKMEKSGMFLVAKQHKFTAPKTYVAYFVRVDDCTL